MNTVLINAIVFKIAWLCCVVAAANHLPWLGTSIALLVAGWHISGTESPRDELLLVLSAGIIGATWDSLLVYAGWLQYPAGTLIEGAAPHWIIAMWLLFATTLNVSLRWLKQRLYLAAAIGAIAGPAAFYAGHKLGGVQIPDFMTAMLALGLGWSVLMPALILLSNRLDGTRHRSATSPVIPDCDARV